MKTNNYNNMIFIIFLLMGLLFLLWKVNYGYIYNDEPFLLGLGYRLVNGDAMIAHEWSVMSIVSFLIYPFMYIYNLFNPTTEGIAMFGRYCFIFIWTFTIIFTYIRLKKYGIFATIGCMIFYLFAPLDMMTLSYNSFALSSLLITCTLLVTAKNKIDLTLIGVFFSFAVLSLPFLIIIYFIFSLFVLITLPLKKDIKLNEHFSIKEGWLYITLGAGSILVIFLIFIFSKISIETFINQLKYFEITNGEHPIPEFFEFVFNFRDQVILRFEYFIYTSLILSIIIIIDKNRQKHSVFYLSTTFLILLLQYIYLLNLADTYPRMNLIAVPFTLIGIVSFLLTKRKNFYVFIYFIISSFINSIVINLTSNLGIMAISSMYIISSFGSMLLLKDLYDEIKDNHINIIKPINIIIICCIVLQLGNQLFYRYKYYYMDKTIDQLKYKTDRGPGKGTIIHGDRIKNHYNVYDQVKELTYDIENNDTFVFLEHVPWFFLINNTKWATYSTWGYWIDGNPNIEKTLEINMMYYKEHPEKFPTYVLLFKENKNLVTDFILLLESKNYNIRESKDFILYYK